MRVALAARLLAVMPVALAARLLAVMPVAGATYTFVSSEGPNYVVSDHIGREFCLLITEAPFTVTWRMQVCGCRRLRLWVSAPAFVCAGTAGWFRRAACVHPDGAQGVGATISGLTTNVCAESHGPECTGTFETVLVNRVSRLR